MVSPRVSERREGGRKEMRARQSDFEVAGQGRACARKPHSAKGIDTGANTHEKRASWRMGGPERHSARESSSFLPVPEMTCTIAVAGRDEELRCV